MKLISIPWKHCSENMWILKPTNSNQGRGIEVFKELTKIKSFMRGKPKGEEWIFQKYLERPLLLWGRKFDIRVWVTVTENFEIYIHNEGYLRTSSESYTTDLDNTKPFPKKLLNIGCRLINILVALNTQYCTFFTQDFLLWL